MILDFDPISKIFQEVGHAIRSGDPWINRINMSKLDFLAGDDLPQVRLPVHQIPHQLAIPFQQVPLEAKAAVERIASSSRLSLEEDIDRFRFAEEERTPKRPVEISDTETESDKFSTAHQPEQTIALVEISSEEAKNIDLKKRPSLRGLIANRNKGVTPLEIPKAQTSTNLSLPPPLAATAADLGLHVNLDPKKKRPPQELEEGEMLL